MHHTIGSIVSSKASSCDQLVYSTINELTWMNASTDSDWPSGSAPFEGSMINGRKASQIYIEWHIERSESDR